jgi:hypothetical protein
MKKLLLFVSSCILLSISAFSQTFHHGIGIGAYFDNLIPDKITASSTLIYNPRFYFNETDWSSISIGIPLGIGYTADSYDNYDVDGNPSSSGFNSFSVDVPLMVNLNLGQGASSLFKGNMGGYVGVGYAYHYSSSREYYKNDILSKVSGGRSFGAVINGGIRFNIGEPMENVELRLSYFSGHNRKNLGMFGLGIIFNL